MSRQEKKRSRREFIKDSALIAAGASVASCFPEVGGKWPIQRAQCYDETIGKLVPPKARLAEYYNEASLYKPPDSALQEIVPEKVREMVVTLLKVYSSDAPNPWRYILPDYQEGMRIGIKINCLNGDCPTSIPVVQGVVESLKQDLNIAAENIIVWDRYRSELEQCGFSPDIIGAQISGTYDRKDSAMGPGYEQEYCLVTGQKMTFLSRIFTEQSDLTINCPVLKSHGVSGVTAALKNIYGIINNPGEFHEDIQEALPKLYSLVPIRTRIRFTLVDAIQAVVAGDTESSVDFYPGCLFASQDPLAVDTYALQTINRCREELNEIIKARNETEGSNIPLKEMVDESVTQWLHNARLLGLGSSEYDVVRPQI